MSLGSALLPEYDQEMAGTRKVLERIPADRFDWRPHEKSFSFGELANHLARIPEWGAATLESESMDLDPEAGEFELPDPTDSPEELLEIFDTHAARFRSALAEATDEDLLTPWTLKEGDTTYFTMPRLAVIRSMIMNHMIHHRAQLGVYLRLNDLPVPGLYGPSADESGESEG